MDLNLTIDLALTQREVDFITEAQARKIANLSIECHKKLNKN